MYAGGIALIGEWGEGKLVCRGGSGWPVASAGTPELELEPASPSF